MTSQDLAADATHSHIGVSIARISPYVYAIRDFTDGLKQWRIWLLLAYQDIQLRYRRSVIGPFWLTLSMAILVYSMGYLYAHLFHQNLTTYYPFLVTGMLSWTLISTIIMEISDGLIVAEGLIKNIKLSYFLHMHRIAMRNIIIFFHNILVLIPIFLIYSDNIKISRFSLLMFYGLALIYFNTLTFGMIVSMIGARYRDFSQVVKSLLQVIFFVTPIMWNPSVLGDKFKFIVIANPIYAFVEILRAPLLGTLPSGQCILMSFIMTLMGLVICFLFFSKYRSRIIFWL